MRFAGRRVLVAGGGSIGPGMGNGKAAALAYAREGASVLVVDRVLAAAEETVALIAAEGGAAEAHAADLTDAEAAADAVAAAGARLDVLHFNVGTSVRGGVAETAPEDWARVMDVNLTAAYLTARAAIPVMRAQGGGAMVFISSVAAVRAGPYAYAAYEASKAALGRMAQSIAAAEAAHGIRANVIVPGVIDTPHVTTVVAPDADPVELARARAALVPLGRQGSPWDVAQAATFLASDDAAYITGALLPVDGGLTL
ncbi:SDR family oxidoreductase [Rhodobacteraceae bacterium CCMM004]|nr:SDR family oxidoreductase [Rhodobacteraceae bacterium CCMM004]